MTKTEIKAAIEAKLKELGVPLHYAHVRAVRSTVEVAVLGVGRVYKASISSGVTKTEVEREMRDLARAYSERPMVSAQLAIKDAIAEAVA